MGAELLDLQFGGLLPDGIDPIEVAEGLPPRYEALWDEVTHEQVFGIDEQQLAASPSGSSGSTTSGSTSARSS